MTTNDNTLFMETETLLPAIREIELGALNKIEKIGKEEFAGTIGIWGDNDQANCGINPLLMDHEHNVDMTFSVRWITKNQLAPFATEETHGEKWKFIRKLAVAWTASGETWDERTLNLHPAVAGLATTDAGFDAAYLSALAATGQLLAQTQRVDISQKAREHIGRMLRQNIQPFRLLMRGASMWLSLATTQASPVDLAPVAAECRTIDPRPMNLPQNFNGHLLNHADAPHDAIYVRLEDSNAHGILAALVAMTGSSNPVSAAPAGLKAMWPPMHAPVVYYSADFSTPPPRAGYSREEVWLALAKVCETYDCWDLLQEAFCTVATMVSRPEGMATWMGRDRFVWNLPASDFKAGICGPLFNGVSAQGMKTHPISEPDYRKMLIEGCVRANFVLASAYVHLSNYAETHYALRGLSDIERPLLANLASLKFTQRFNDACGSISTALGWSKAMGRSLRGIRLGAGQALSQVFMDCMNYPSVLTLLPWTKSTHMDSLATAILRPAIPEIPKRFNGWMRIEHRGIVSDAQIAAAITRLPVRLRFRVEYPNGNVRHVEGPGHVSANRGMPLLTARLRRTDVKVSTQLLITNPLAFLERTTFCTQLNSAHVVVEQKLTEEIDLNFWDEEEPWDEAAASQPKYSELMSAEEAEAEMTAAKYTQQPEELQQSTDPAYTTTPPTAKEMASLLKKYTKLELGKAFEVSLDAPPSKGPLTTGIQPGTEKVQALFEGKKPQEVLEQIPRNMRASLASQVASYLGAAASMSRNSAITLELRRNREQYAALAGALETDEALTPEELADRNKLRSRALWEIPNTVEAAAAMLVEGKEGEAAKQLEEVTLGGNESWATEMENNDQPGFQQGSSGTSASVPASGTHTQDPIVESAGEISAPSSGAIGFADPAGSSR